MPVNLNRSMASCLWKNYKLFGCETGEPDFEFDMGRGISEGFLAPYKPIELISSLVAEAKKNGIEFEHVLDPQEKYLISLGAKKKLKLEQLNRKSLSALPWLLMQLPLPTRH
jgi:type I restriction enzyme, R subunit